MAIAKYDKPPESTTTKKVVTNKSATIDSGETSLATYARYMDYPIQVADYYAQILGEIDTPTPHDGALPDILQQYTLIKSYPLLITDSIGDISYEFTDELDVEGAAIFRGPMTPNPGDMLVLDIPGGVRGIFTVMNVQHKSLSGAAVYAIQYKLKTVINNNIGETSYEDLNSKVVRIRKYVEKASCGGGVVVTEEEANATNMLEDLIGQSVTNYINAFLDRESLLLVIPGQSTRIYDPWITEFIQNIGDVYKYPLLATVRQVNVSDDPCLDQPMLWGAILARSTSRLHTSHYRVGMVDATAFNPTVYTDVVRWSWVNKVMYPMYPQDYSPHFNNCKPASLLDIKTAANQYNDLSFLLSSTESNYISRVIDDEFYVFSRNFYTGGEVSQFERTVLDYIDGTNPKAEDLVSYIKDSYKWGLLEQFYYIPIIWGLARAVL